jgi:VanZ family protein
VSPGRRVLSAAISLLIYAVIFYLSSLQPSELPSGIPDVIPHVGEYALLAFFLVQVFPAPPRRRSLAAAFLLTLLLGLLDECHQLSTPGRLFSWLDVLYDGLGAALGLAAFDWLAGRKGFRQ